MPGSEFRPAPYRFADRVFYSVIPLLDSGTRWHHSSGTRFRVPLPHGYTEPRQPTMVRSVMPIPDRRKFLKRAGSGVLLTGLGVNMARAARQITAAATSGPFYPVELPLDSDADLVQVDGQSQLATGDITHLLGAVLDSSGNPLQGLVVEIWQCDAFGFYRHPNDRGNQAEPGFQGFGRAVTDDHGRYHQASMLFSRQ